MRLPIYFLFLCIPLISSCQERKASAKASAKTLTQQNSVYAGRFQIVDGANVIDDVRLVFTEFRETFLPTNPDIQFNIKHSLRIERPLGDGSCAVWSYEASRSLNSPADIPFAKHLATLEATSTEAHGLKAGFYQLGQLIVTGGGDGYLAVQLNKTPASETTLPCTEVDFNDSIRLDKSVLAQAKIELREKPKRDDLISTGAGLSKFDTDCTYADLGTHTAGFGLEREAPQSRIYVNLLTDKVAMIVFNQDFDSVDKSFAKLDLNADNVAFQPAYTHEDRVFMQNIAGAIESTKSSERYKAATANWPYDTNALRDLYQNALRENGLCR